MELAFHEDEYMVKTLRYQEELSHAYYLRHEVFCDELKWVPPRQNMQERDAYDNAYSQSIGVFKEDLLVGYLRLIPAPFPFMIDKEFSCLLPIDMKPKQKTLDTAEVTRFCVKKQYREVKHASYNIALLLYKGLYHWNFHNGIRYSAMVVDYRYYRLLRMVGLPVEPDNVFIKMPDGVKAAVCTLDWDKFQVIAKEKKSKFLKWMNDVPLSTEKVMLPFKL